jgi:hypothetical protein
MKIIHLAAIFFLFICPVSILAQQHQLVKKWETDSLLKVPESVLFDGKANMLYVSNIDGDPSGKDGKGSIGKVGLDGRIIEVDWISGLSAPKGMAIHKNNLYVADIDQVVVIDIKKGVISKRIPIEGSVFLNDVTVDRKGIVYVSDSRASKVHKIKKGKSSVYLENLKGPNGVLAFDGDLYVLNSGSVLKVLKDKSMTSIADSLVTSTDGIENVKGKDFIVSCWSGVIYYVSENGTTEKLLDTRDAKINSADIGYDAKNRVVYVPTFYKNSVVAYDLK